MSRTLVLPINIKMDQAVFGKVEQMVAKPIKELSRRRRAKRS